MLNTGGWKLLPFLEDVAIIVTRSSQVSEVDSTGVFGVSDSGKFFYLGAGYWRAIAEPAEIGWNVSLVNPGIKDAEVRRVEEATKVILNGGKENGLH